MRVTVASQSERHTDACTAVAVALSGEILSGGDDFSVWRWNSSGEPVAKVLDLESCVTFVRWMPGSGTGKKKAGESGKDMCLVACADGTMRFVNVASSRVEKVVEAHIGAVTSVVYAPDGSSIVSAGEDGLVKVWSQAGIQRSVLCNAGKCIYTLCWGTESAEFAGECVMYSVGSDVIVKPMNPSVKKQLKWKAHNGVVLCTDWARMSNLIITGGEDGTFKVWDAYGRNIFTSPACEHPVTSLSFAADGEMFAVGSFTTLRICDKTGWSHCCERTIDTGSVLSLQWTADGTQIAYGTGTGKLCVSQLVDRKLYWGNYSVSLSDGKKLHIQDVLTEVVEELEQRDKVIKLAIGHGYLVVCTTTQCICYDVQRFSNPVQFDLRDAVITLLLAEKHFLIADCSQGIQIYGYDGRQISTVKLAVTLRPEILANNILSLSADTIAIRDPTDTKKIIFYDPSTGKQHKDAGISHHLDILDVTLSQYGSLQDRKVAFADRSRDLYLACVHAKLSTQKISTMASSISWHDKNETLVAISDGKLLTWYFPTVVFTDRDLLPRTKHVRDDGCEEFSRNDRIQDFSSTRVGIRRGVDGALLTFSVSPYPAMLFAHVSRHDWSGATRLCRFLNDELLWAILTAMAIKLGELNTAEVGYGALAELDKVRYIRNLKEIASPEGRQAELAVFIRRVDEAERILMQASLIYRAIEMHCRLYNWERALEIAVMNRTHTDTVLGRRQQYLEAVGRKETLDKFKQTAQTVKVDWDIINEKVKGELQKEQARASSKPYQK
jgi:intraflagellar transport protein 80